MKGRGETVDSDGVFDWLLSSKNSMFSLNLTSFPFIFISAYLSEETGRETEHCGRDFIFCLSLALAAVAFRAITFGVDAWLVFFPPLLVWLLVLATLTNKKIYIYENKRNETILFFRKNIRITTHFLLHLLLQVF